MRDVLADWGVAPGRLGVVHDAAVLEDHSRADAVNALRRRFQRKRVVGCVASLVPAKDHATLLRVAQRLAVARSDTVVLLVGDGRLRRALEEQARALGLANVVFEGFPADPDSYYKVFDAFALTSIEEGLPSAILEAFCYAVPVVATRAGGVPELVRDGDTGLLCDMGDDEAVARGLLRVLEDANLRDHLTQGARRHLEGNFTVDRMAAKYIELYDGLVRPAPSDASRR